MKRLTPAISRLILPSLIFISRLSILPANISPLGSYGFFSKNTLLYFATIIPFDIFIGGLYPGFWITYLGFAIYPVLGRLATHSRAKLLLLPLASFGFFLVSNLGVWLYWYPHTFTGLITCFTLALPFYTRTLAGDIVFGYGYLLAHHLRLRSHTQISHAKISLAHS